MKPRFQSSDVHRRRWFAGFSFAESWVEVLLTLLGLFYVSYRFIKLPLAPDEWGILHSIRHHSFVDWFTNADSQDVNPLQHFLFSVVSRISFCVFPGNEIQRIRIPSLLAFGVFLSALWRLKRQFANRFIGAFTFAALLANAYVLDYFSVARGYGMAMAFALWSLASLLEIEDGKPGWGSMAVWSAVLAAMSNLAFLYFYGVMLLAALLLSRREKLVHLFWLASSVVFVGAIYLSKILIMRQHNMAAFWWGGTDFVSDTILSLVKCSLYHGAPFYPWPSTRPEIALAWVAVGLALAAAIGLFWTRHKRGCIVTFCGLAIVALIYVGHYLLHVPLPVERAAMYFIPLFVLQIACLADGTPRRWLRSALAALLLAYSVTAAWGLNLTHMCISKVMADIPALIQDLTSMHQENGTRVVVCLSDGTKWQVWYYAELAANLPEDERMKERECWARIDWLYVFEVHCGAPTKEGRMSTPATTELFLSSDDYPPTWFLHNTVLVREYPVSHWRLYAKNESTRAGEEESPPAKPDYADGHCYLGDDLLQEGKIGEAIGQYEQALRINPDYAVAHNNLANALAQTGKIEEAIAHFEQAVRIKPDYAEARNSLGKALLQTGRIKESIAHFEQTLRIKPDYAEAHNNLGVALLQTGKIKEAIGHFEQALRIKPDAAEGHYNLGLALARLGRMQDAIGHWEQAVRIKPDYAEAHNDLGTALARAGKIEEAIPHFEQTLRLKPDLAEGHYKLALALAQAGRMEEAIAHFEQALRLKPDLAEGHCALGMALEQAGRIPEAIEHYQQALRIKPDFRQAQDALRQLQARQ